MHISRQSVEIPFPLRGERVRVRGWGLGVVFIVSLVSWLPNTRSLVGRNPGIRQFRIQWRQTGATRAAGIAVSFNIGAMDGQRNPALAAKLAQTRAGRWKRVAAPRVLAMCEGPPAIWEQSWQRRPTT